MLEQVLITILLSTLSFQANCVHVKRSLFDIAPLQVRFPPNIQMANPNARQPNRPLFSVPNFQAPLQFAGKILNGNNNNIISSRYDDTSFNNNYIMPRRYYDTSENSLNGRVDMKYEVNANSNQANEQSGKDHTFKVTTTKPTTTTSPAKGEEEDIWNDIFNGNIFTTPSMDSSTDDLDTTESTTEFETTTTDDLLNRMAIPSAVLASLAG